MSAERWSERAAAYALDALDADEREAFEARLAVDAELRREVAAYRDALAAVAGALPAPAVPPQALRERILARARAERGGGTGSMEPGSPAAGPAPGGDREGGDRAGGATTAIGRERPAPARALPWILLAASVAGLVWLGLENRRVEREAEVTAARLDELRGELAGAEAELARLDSLTDVLTGSDVRFATLTGAAAPSLRLVWNADSGALLVAARDLPPPAPGRTYQLWGIRGDEAPVSLGIFATGPEGTALVTLAPGVAASFDVSAITDEPAGGSPQPTTQPFLLGAWTGARP
jgi:anti-sigma-K factor RskA